MSDELVDYKDIQIITKNKINIIQNIFSSYKKCIIFGKGPTLKYFKKDENKDTLFVCINNTINYIKKCDLLVCNDIESFNDINLKYLENCKNILIPYHIHWRCKFNPNISYINVIKKIKDNFKGNLIIYNLRTAAQHERHDREKYNNYINLESCSTSIHTGFEFVINYIENLDLINFYGFAKQCANRKICLYTKKAAENKHLKAHPIYREQNNKLNKTKKIKYIINY